MQPSPPKTRWPVWVAGWIFVGILCALSEWVLLRNPGPYGFLAGIAGTVIGGLTSHFTRGGAWRFGGISAVMVGGLAGVKSGSVLWAIVMGLIGGVLEGLLTRLIAHRLKKSKQAVAPLWDTEIE